jgi:hypothetical protein
MATGGAFWINIENFGEPVFYADATTPMSDLKADLGGIGFDNDHAQVPFPANAAADPSSDGSLCIVDAARHTSWDMWQAKRTGNTWTCTVCAASDLTGDGVRPPQANANPWNFSVGARASGFPLLAGLMLVDELKAGTINHALAVAYQHIKSSYYTPPASTAQGTTSDAIPTRGMPSGARLQLDPTLDITTLGLSASGRAIAKAMQDYGLYVADFSGAVTLYVEAGATAQQALKGMLDHNAAEKIPVSRLRVLKIGQLYNQHN